MDTVLGLFGVAAWIVFVITLAAFVTYVVVKVTPGEKPGEPDSAQKAEG